MYLSIRYEKLPNQLRKFAVLISFAIRRVITRKSIFLTFGEIAATSIFVNNLRV